MTYPLAALQSDLVPQRVGSLAERVGLDFGASSDDADLLGVGGVVGVPFLHELLDLEVLNLEMVFFGRFHEAKPVTKENNGQDAENDRAYVAWKVLASLRTHGRIFVFELDILVVWSSHELWEVTLIVV